MKIKLLGLMLLCVTVLTACPPTPLPALYMYTASSSSELWVVDLTGNNQDRKIGAFKNSSGNTFIVFDLAWNGTDLFGLSSTGQFLRVNPANAAVTFIGNTGGGTTLNSLAFDGNGQVWAAGDGILYRYVISGDLQN